MSSEHASPHFENEVEKEVSSVEGVASKAPHREKTEHKKPEFKKHTAAKPVAFNPEATEGITFDSLALASKVKSNIASMNMKTPTKIQALAMPHALEMKDVVGLAGTGSGKTLAFLAPVITKLLETKDRHVQTLVLAPTRELAEQILRVAAQLTRGTHVFSVLVVGGQPMGKQISELRRGAQLVIGCPGRVLDLMSQRRLDLSRLTTLVLDEADQMLNMGFIPDVREICESCPENRQTMLFSATLSKTIEGLTREFLSNPERVDVREDSAPKKIDHQVHFIPNAERSEKLFTVLSDETITGAIVFVRTKRQVQDLADEMYDRGINVARLEGEMPPNARRRSMDQLRTGQRKIMIATDVAARGLDVSTISHVINYDLPMNIESYVHRTGRTGRCDREGIAISFAHRAERGFVQRMKTVVNGTVTVTGEPEGFDRGGSRGGGGRRPFGRGGDRRGGGGGGNRRFGGGNRRYGERSAY